MYVFAPAQEMQVCSLAMTVLQTIFWPSWATKMRVCPLCLTSALCSRKMTIKLNECWLYIEKSFLITMIDDFLYLDRWQKMTIHNAKFHYLHIPINWPASLLISTEKTKIMITTKIADDCNRKRHILILGDLANWLYGIFIIYSKCS